jgi:hypothetical protein
MERVDGQLIRDRYQLLLNSNDMASHWLVPRDIHDADMQALTDYCRIIRGKLSVFGETDSADVGSAVIEFTVPDLYFNIYCFAWSVVVSYKKNTHPASKWINHTRGEILRRLDAIIVCHNNICTHVHLLPQPIAEEIIPHIYATDKIVGIFNC